MDLRDTPERQAFLGNQEKKAHQAQLALQVIQENLAQSARKVNLVHQASMERQDVKAQ